MAVFVVQARTGRELLAAVMLERRLGLAVYLPQVLQWRRGRTEMTPLFPGYLFARSEPACFTRSAVDAQPGVVRVVTIGATPCVVEDDVLAALQARVDALNAAGGLPLHPFKPGDVVQLRSGPLAGMEAIFVGPTTPSERVEILLHFLGRTQRTRVNVSALEAVTNPQSAPHPPRRTRGHGRRIGAWTREGSANHELLQAAKVQN